MKWVTKYAGPEELRFIIKKERVYDKINSEYLDWYYLYVYKKNNTKYSYSYQQESLDVIESTALENFGVPLDSWQQVE